MPSAEELAKRGGDFKNLPEDQYVLELVEVVVKEDQRNPYNNEVRDTLTVKWSPKKFADGSPLVDVDGDDVRDDKYIWDFIDPTKVGMRPQPSKARKFFTSLLGLPVGAGFAVDDYQDLLGLRVIGNVIIREAEGDKPESNKVTDYRAVPKRPARKAAPAQAEAEDEGSDEAAEAEAPSKAPRLPGEKKATKASTKKAALADDDDDDDDF